MTMNYRFSYFWGYFISQIPAARIAENLSAKYVMLFSVAINVVCTILTPLAAKLHYNLMILMRILEGIGGGTTFPAMVSRTRKKKSFNINPNGIEYSL